MGRKRKDYGTCPRCGLPISCFDYKNVGGRRYVYAIHYLGKGKRKKCYLGPLDAYVYASVTHKHNIYGLLEDKLRTLEYIRSNLRHLIELELERGEAQEIIEELEETAQKLREKMGLVSETERAREFIRMDNELSDSIIKVFIKKKKYTKKESKRAKEFLRRLLLAKSLILIK